MKLIFILAVLMATTSAEAKAPAKKPVKVSYLSYCRVGGLKLDLRVDSRGALEAQTQHLVLDLKGLNKKTKIAGELFSVSMNQTKHLSVESCEAWEKVFHSSIHRKAKKLSAASRSTAAEKNCDKVGQMYLQVGKRKYQSNVCIRLGKATPRSELFRQIYEQTAALLNFE